VFPLNKEAYVFTAPLNWFLIFCDSRMIWWHEQGEQLELYGKQQADPEGWMLDFPDFEGPYQWSIWIANKNTGKYNPGRKWRWGRGFEVFVSLPCPMLKFSFTFKFTEQFLSQVRWNWNTLWLLLNGSWINSSILHGWTGKYLLLKRFRANSIKEY